MSKLFSLCCASHNRACRERRAQRAQAVKLLVIALCAWGVFLAVVIKCGPVVLMPVGGP